MDSSVISAYIRRFREEQPVPPGQRKPIGNRDAFWWVDADSTGRERERGNDGGRLEGDGGAGLGRTDPAKSMSSGFSDLSLSRILPKESRSSVESASHLSAPLPQTSLDLEQYTDQLLSKCESLLQEYQQEVREDTAKQAPPRMESRPSGLDRNTRDRDRRSGAGYDRDFAGGGEKGGRVRDRGSDRSERGSDRSESGDEDNVEDSDSCSSDSGCGSGGGGGGKDSHRGNALGPATPPSPSPSSETQRTEQSGLGKSAPISVDESAQTEPLSLPLSHAPMSMVYATSLGVAEGARSGGVDVGVVRVCVRMGTADVVSVSIAESAGDNWDTGGKEAGGRGGEMEAEAEEAEKAEEAEEAEAAEAGERLLPPQCAGSPVKTAQSAQSEIQEGEAVEAQAQALAHAHALVQAARQFMSDTVDTVDTDRAGEAEREAGSSPHPLFMYLSPSSSVDSHISPSPFSQRSSAEPTFKHRDPLGHTEQREHSEHRTASGVATHVPVELGAAESATAGATGTAGTAGTAGAEGQGHGSVCADFVQPFLHDEVVRSLWERLCSVRRQKQLLQGHTQTQTQTHTQDSHS
jgi:hypothetical protein